MPCGSQTSTTQVSGCRPGLTGATCKGRGPGGSARPQARASGTVGSSNLFLTEAKTLGVVGSADVRTECGCRGELAITPFLVEPGFPRGCSQGSHTEAQGLLDTLEGSQSADSQVPSYGTTVSEM